MWIAGGGLGRSSTTGKARKRPARAAGARPLAREIAMAFYDIVIAAWRGAVSGGGCPCRKPAGRGGAPHGYASRTLSISAAAPAPRSPQPGAATDAPRQRMRGAARGRPGPVRGGCRERPRVQRLAWTRPPRARQGRPHAARAARGAGDDAGARSPRRRRRPHAAARPGWRRPRIRASAPAPCRQ